MVFAARRFGRLLRGVPTLVAVSVAGAILPIAVAGARAAANGWMPVGERAYPAVRAADVFSRHPPLVGMHTSVSEYAGRIVHHPGPLLFYVLAPWVKLFGPGVGTALGVATLNAACVLAAAWLAYRRAGQLGAVATMVALASLAWSLGSAKLYDPWPPHVTLFPFALYLVAGWSVADRDLVALPVLVASGSFVFGTHLGFALLVPTIALVAVAMAGRELLAPDKRRWVVAGAAVGLVCWALPLYEQIRGPDGNLVGLLRAIPDSDGNTMSLPTSIQLVASTVVLPPWWLPPSFGSTTVPQTVGAPVALVSLCGAAALAILGARWMSRNGRGSVAAGIKFLLLCQPLFLLTVTRAPVRLGPVPMYYRYLWVDSAIVAVVGVVALGAWLRARPPLPGWVQRYGLWAGAGLAVLAGVVALPAADRENVTTYEWLTIDSRQVAHDVLAATDGKGPLLVDPTIVFNSPTADTAATLLPRLDKAGVEYVARHPLLVAQIGDHRTYEPGSATARVIIVDAGGRPPLTSSGRLISSTLGLSQDERSELRELREALAGPLEDCGEDEDELLSDAFDEDRLGDLADCDSMPADTLEDYISLRRSGRPHSVDVYLDVPPTA